MGISTSSYNTPEIQAYDGLLKLVAAATDLIKNPPDLQKARLEALAVIDEAKSASAALDATHALKMTVHQETADKLHSKASANEAKALEIKNAQKELDSRLAALSDKSIKLETLKSELEAKQAKLAAKESDLSKITSSLDAKEQALLALETKLMDIEKMLSDKSNALATKEAALRQFLG